MLKLTKKFLKPSNLKLQIRSFSNTPFSRKAKDEDEDDDGYEYEYVEVEYDENAPKEKEKEIPIDEIEGEWRIAEMSRERLLEKTKKLIPHQEVQPNSKGFGMEGHVMEDFSIFKDEPDPVVKARSEYPDWLHADFMKPDPTEDDLLEIQKTRKLNDKEKKRLIKLVRKRKIKELNNRYLEGQF